MRLFLFLAGSIFLASCQIPEREKPAVPKRAAPPGETTLPKMVDRLQVSAPPIVISRQPIQALSDMRQPELPTIPIMDFLHAIDDNLAVPYIIDLRKDTTLSLPKGTWIDIPANAFVDAETGEPVHGEVQLSVKECYSVADFVMANLATSTEKEILETGGMIHLSVRDAGGRKCEIAPGKTLGLRFPTSDYKPEMQLFTGVKAESGVVLWEADQELSVIDDTLAFITVEKAPEYPDGFAAMMRFIQKNLRYPRPARRACQEGTVYVQFIVRKSGDIVEVGVLRGVASSLDEEAVRVIKAMPRWKPGRQSGKDVNTRMVLPIRFRMDCDGAVGREVVESVEKALNDSTERKEIGVQALSSYVMQTAKLGWINCDRFLNFPNQVTYRVYVPGSDDQQVRLIFNKFNSILPGIRSGDYHYFDGVPKGEAVTVLGLAQSREGPKMTMRASVISEKVDTLGTPQVVTVQNLREELNKLKSSLR